MPSRLRQVAIHLGQIVPSPGAEEHIQKHDMTLYDVRQALQAPAPARSAWEEHPVRGRRVVAVGETQGRRVIAYLLPIPPWDEYADTWELRSGRWVDGP